MLSPIQYFLCYALLISLHFSFFFTDPNNPIPTTSIYTTTKTPSRFTSLTTNTIPPLPPPPPPPLDDNELFHLASQVNQHPHPTSSPKKLAFMFMTSTPLPFAPLWELYFHQPPPNLFNIYIHADPNFPYTPPFSGIFSDCVIPSKPTQRGSPSLISAARRLLAHALLHDSSNSIFLLISSSCIPLHSFNFTYTTLISSNKSFIEIRKHQHNLYNRYLARGKRKMLPEIPFKQFRSGSQFFILTRGHARLVVRDKRLWRKFKLPCIRPATCYPEEHYFSTLLSMKDGTACVPATLTHVDWSKNVEGHPRMYNAPEVNPELIISLRRRRLRYGDDGTVDDASDANKHDTFLFARKFSQDCVEPLLDLVHDVIFQDYL